MTSSEDRYVKQPVGEDPREIDRELTDSEFVARREAGRQVSHRQEAEGAQGISSDAPGVDASDRDRAPSGGSAGKAGEAGEAGEADAADSTDSASRDGSGA
jgi:hypothetical protein